MQLIHSNGERGVYLDAVEAHSCVDKSSDIKFPSKTQVLMKIFVSS